MINLVDSAQSLAASVAGMGASGAQIAAAPANISSAPPRQTKSAATSTVSAGNVSISAEGLRQLQREQELASMDAAKIGNREVVARMAYAMAYDQDAPVRPSVTAGNAMTVKGAPASVAYAVSDAESRLEHARFARIALYELESARGTPPEEIYDKLQALKAARPETQRIGTGG